MLKIKFSNQFPEWNWSRQTPGCKGIWKDAHFFVNDDKVQECDYYVVLGGLNQKEEVFCPEGNRIFIAVENPNIYNYHQKFLDQFDKIITHRSDINHKDIIPSIFPAYWFIGRRQSKEQTISWSKSYDELKNTESSDKTKLLSVIISNKAFTGGHKLRLVFLEKLKEHFRGQLDVFGRGINEVEDKWDAIAPYKYHIVLENSHLANEVTEKLYDTYLSQSYPIYYGAPNVTDVFDSKSLTTIDIENSDEALLTIEKCISENRFERSREQIRLAKEKVLEEYNLFEIIYKHIDTRHSAALEKVAFTFYPEHLYTERKTAKEQTIYHRLKSNFVKILKR